MEKLSKKAVCSYLRHDFIDVTVKECAGSTNTELKLLAEASAKEGSLIAVDSQTAGRGRVGRSFISPSGGVYMSILLRPKLNFKDSLLITTCAAVSTAEAIRDVTGKDVDIKWVNDLYYNGKKVCGILTEAPYDSETGGVRYAVLGIGINLFEAKEGYGEYSSIAGSLLKGRPDGELKSHLTAAVADRFFDRYGEMASESLRMEYRRRLFIIGRDVEVLRGGICETMRVIDIDKNYNLVLKRDNGEIISLSSGEIRIIPK